MDMVMRTGDIGELSKYKINYIIFNSITIIFNFFNINNPTYKLK